VLFLNINTYGQGSATNTALFKAATVMHKRRQHHDDKADIDFSDCSLHPDRLKTENKMSQHASQRKSLNFYPTALFSAKPYLLSLLQKQKRRINFFIFYFGMRHICFCPNAQNSFFIVQLQLKFLSLCNYKN
jgi:hypothetical protein